MNHQIITHDKPVYEHDCDACKYLGTYTHLASSSDEQDKFIDCYWCVNPEHRSLDSVIGREGSDGSNYASSHPPEAFADKNYLQHARSWYLFALIQASRMGLYTFSPIK